MLFRHPQLFLTAFCGLTLGLSFPSQAQPQSQARLSWNLGDSSSSGEVQLRACTQANFDSSGGCARGDVAAESVATRGGRTLTNLQSNTPHRVCLVAQNLPGRSGPWLACQGFTPAGGDLSFSFRSEDLVRGR